MINLDDPRGSGTHWTCYINMYFNLFGLPPHEISVLLKRFNNLQYRDPNQ